MYRVKPGRSLAPALLLTAGLCLTGSASAKAQQPPRESIIQRIEEAGHSLKMIKGTSRILTLDQKIPRAQVNNQEIVELTPLAPNRIQVSALNPGITQINVWDEQDNVSSIDVVVYGDTRELEMILREQYPHASIKATATANSIILSGFIDRPDQIGSIIEIAKDYSPKVVNNVQVGGVPQVLLHTKVMEVSRTKLRRLRSDLNIADSSAFVITSVSGLINAAAAATGSVGSGVDAATGTAGLSNADTIRFGVVTNDSAFFGLIDFLNQNNVAKILAEPALVTMSGRPAFFNDGGEFPILVPQSLGTVSIQYKRFGTQIDFIPIVLGNGRIRLEVRPRISEIDATRSIVVNSQTIFALRVREADTALEMTAGQTFALAGLVQTRVEAEKAVIPILGDIPYLGVPFRRVKHTEEELELLILVTPELVDAMNPGEVPPCGPGQEAGSPTDHELYWQGYMEVPSCANCGPQGPGTAGNPVMGPEGIPTPAGEVVVEDGTTTGTPVDVNSASLIPPGSRVPVGMIRQGPAAQPVSAPYNQSVRQSPYAAPTTYNAGSAMDAPGLLGPVGYDVDN